jgi:hypothetical protein
VAYCSGDNGYGQIGNERPIRYLRGTRQEFDHRRQSGDPFRATVFREPRLEVVGKTPGDS